MVRFEKEEGYYATVLTCHFSGRLDTEECTHNEKDIETNIQNNANASVVFDLAQVEYISSAFLRICLKVGKTLGKEKFSIINVQPQVMKVFKISSFDTILTIK